MSDLPPEEWKPVVVHGKENPWYEISSHGNLISHIRYTVGQKTCYDPSYSYKMRATLKKDRLRYQLFFPKDFFKNTSIEEVQYVKNANDWIRKDIYVHQLVMWAFKPIDLFPPERLKLCWNVLPDIAKEWIAETVVINHIDHDPLNNHYSNLEYVTQGENTRKAKAFYGGNHQNAVDFKKDKSIVFDGEIKNALTEMLGI